jgi:hypothetical protein
VAVRVRSPDGALASYWPEAFIGGCWLILLLATHFVFRDDESLAHRAAYLGLWLSLAVYVGMTVREYRSPAR